MSNTIAIEGFLAEMYPMEYLSLDANNLIKECDVTPAMEGEIGDRIKGLIKKFCDWLKKTIRMIVDKVRDLMNKNKQLEVQQSDAKLVVSEPFYKHFSRIITRLHRDADNTKELLLKIQAFCKSYINQFKNGAYKADFSDIEKEVDDLSTKRDTRVELMNEVKREFDIDKSATVYDSYEERLRDRSVVAPKKNESISNYLNAAAKLAREYEKYTRVEEVSSLARECGLNDDGHSSFIQEFIRVMTVMYSYIMKLIGDFANIQAMENECYRTMTVAI